MTGQLRIGGALIMGVLIVLGAFVVTKLSDGSPAQATATLEVAPSRTYIDSTDSDGDGTPDWEEEFTDRIFSAIETPTTTAASSTAYMPPTTFTGKFAEAFLKQYMDGKMKGVDVAADPSALVNGAVGAIEANTQSKIFTRTDVLVVPDSDTALRDYGNAVGDILIKYSTSNENEGIILQRALQQNDPAMLEPLKPILSTYEHYIEDTLRVPVPESLITEHLDLVSAYEAIRTDIVAMQQAFSDPLYSLARVKRYPDDAAGLYYALKNIYQGLRAQKVTYANDETGSVLTLWSN